ncbi:MAG: hypothetical protein SNJ72_06290, partial [Fimbriimonadales bacterium]
MRLVGVLVAMAIVGVLVMTWLYYGTGGAGGRSAGAEGLPASPPVSRVGEVRQSAESVECRNNLSQIRMGIQMYQTSNEANPAQLTELQIPASMLQCPVSGQPYQYDPASGQVRCPTPGH